MIVNYTQNGWEIITQRAHGLLAAAIAQQWSHSVRTSRWIETLIAIAEHDDAQVELDCTDVLTPQGGPLDFKMRKMEYEHCKATINFAYSKSTYIALLSSMHLNFVTEKSTADENLKTFLKDQAKQRKVWQKQLGITTADAEHDYRLLEWCDALSLLICQHENQPEARAVDISKGPDNKMHQLKQVDANTLTVSPWPFQLDHFELYFETRVLNKLRFDNADDFKNSFNAAPLQFKTWYFKKI